MDGWREAAVEYHQQRGGGTLAVEVEPERLVELRKLMADDVSLERAYGRIQRLMERDRVAAKTPPWLRRHLEERQEWLGKLELLLLRIGIHGPSVMYEADNAVTITWLRRNWWNGYLQVVEAERDARARRKAGLSDSEHKAQTGAPPWRTE